MSTTLDQSLIDEIVRRILSVAQPDRIILFGSHARGEARDGSDIDLLVLERTPGNTRHESVRIRAALRGLGWPIDVIVMATDWFEASRSVIGALAYPADTEGRVVYASSR